MLSAFGIDHGSVSKGLPSALRGKTSLVSPRFLPPTMPQDGYASARVAAHKAGRMLGSKQYANTQNWSGSGALKFSPEAVKSAGRNYRNVSRRMTK